MDSIGFASLQSNRPLASHGSLLMAHRPVKMHEVHDSFPKTYNLYPVTFSII